MNWVFCVFVDGGSKSHPLDKQSFQMQSLLSIVPGVLFREDIVPEDKAV